MPMSDLPIGLAFRPVGPLPRPAAPVSDALDVTRLSGSARKIGGRDRS